VEPRFPNVNRSDLSREDKTEIRRQLNADIEAFLAAGNEIDRAPAAIDDTNYKPVAVHEYHQY
jgi:hypothetical protein